MRKTSAVSCSLWARPENLRSYASHKDAYGVKKLRMMRAFDQKLFGMTPCKVKSKAAEDQAASEQPADVVT